MSRQLGAFFVILGLIGMVLFITSLKTEQTLCNVGLLSAASILLGVYFYSRKPRHPANPS
jgi:multisubunit Na+/H+ antiporter MnhG subunit